MSFRNEKLSDVKELTPEQYIDAVAKIIALKKMVDEQIQNGQVQIVERQVPVAEVLGLGAPLTFVQTVLAMEGDLTNVKQFFALRDQLEQNPTVAPSTAENNAKVAKARAEYSLFKQSQCEPSQAPAQESQESLEESPLEKMTI